MRVLGGVMKAMHWTLSPAVRWIALLLLLMAKGPGRLSIDHWIARRWR